MLPEAWAKRRWDLAPKPQRQAKNSCAASQATPSMPPNGSVDLVFDFPSGCFDPDCNFIISVDAADDIAEVSERNNLASSLCLC
jgi:hypothetical protein